ncbi:hypothetical protein GALMADRAFT_257494 [Galerina marginata CBS 339.88]|uniref:C2H2-type domain-containing protein n=1 Tax=Galerina marginata (strain CBS 339.88) TaxID=685588 RepID=A0A067SAU7_GALM3|nr:hypothetical protein GALMADRAFT_257494 [Galerina marginata CBS 339.88]
MPTTEVWLRQEDILEHAKNVIKANGWQCEWNIASLQKPTMCRIVLISWNGYLKHLLLHCQEQQNGKANSFVCHLPRCHIPAGVPISSYNDLVSHLQQSHLGRVPLQCPINGCNSSGFSRHAMLETHFSEDHPQLLNQQVTIPSPLMLPLWLPFHPLAMVPPDLPLNIPPGSAIIPPIQGSWKARPHTPLMVEGSKFKLGSPQKRLGGIPKVVDNPEDEPRVTEEIVFEDLPKQLDDEGNYMVDYEQECVIQSAAGPWFDVARPPPPLDPVIFGHRIPPTTIFYDAFVRQHLEELVREEEGEETAEARYHPNTRQGMQAAGPSNVVSMAVD